MLSVFFNDKSYATYIMLHVSYIIYTYIYIHKLFYYSIEYLYICAVFFLCSDQRIVCVDCLLLKLFFSLDPNRPISPGSPCGESGSNDLEWIC